ncbi:phospholipid-binding protein MlaC [Glaciimonas sp. PAMC28666]|uniref:MlaC/ttg2D family ABC transporter substrate-binding protein n=1 Tax=Glaciimonas sp. PAMC28666 TaxID=2807626 RepID=UPI001965EFBD|nr:ABC transporter substrate-binding protein [Glaciimonas sp. PAMC28666]QRX83812.1 ABC transporter substrate-binding protein [Glaciimonas sp. PAMC28666]
MKTLKKYLAIATTFGALTFAGSAFAQEAPDVLVQRISHEVLDTAKADKSIQGGNQQRIFSLVEEKIIPYVDFDRMTSLAAGRYWRDATPDQKKLLTAQFRSLLIYTYSGALAQVRDQKIDFKPMRGTPTDTDVEVRSQVIQPRGEPIQLNYRMEKLADGWKIYDVNVLGAWLVESYKGTFASEIGRTGMDGLIKMLTDKNKALAARGGK